ALQLQEAGGPVDALEVRQQVEAEELARIGIPVRADPLEDSGAVVEGVGHDADARLGQRHEVAAEIGPEARGRVGGSSGGRGPLLQQAKPPQVIAALSRGGRTAATVYRPDPPGSAGPACLPPGSSSVLQDIGEQEGSNQVAKV